MSFKNYILRGPNPLGVAVLLEDGASICGIVVAMFSIALSYIYVNSSFDAVGSCVIGLIQVVLAAILVVKNFSLLVGSSIPQHSLQELEQVLVNDEVVRFVKRATAVQVGAEAVWFRAEVEYNAERIAEKTISNNPKLMAQLTEAVEKGDIESSKKIAVTIAAISVDSVGDEVDRLEKKLKEKNKNVEYIDLENN